MGRPVRSTGDQRGFTIVEMMITLLILGILVTIVVMSFSISRSRAHESACKANLRTIQSALQEYRAMHEGLNPPDLQLLIEPDDPDEPVYLKPSFDWQCPSGVSEYNYRQYYLDNGEVGCDHPGHSL